MGDPLDELLQAELDALTEFINSRLAKFANGPEREGMRVAQLIAMGAFWMVSHRGEAEPEKIERMSKLLAGRLAPRKVN